MACAFQEQNRATIESYAREEEIPQHMIGEIRRHLQPGGGDCDACRQYINSHEAKRKVKPLGEEQATTMVDHLVRQKVRLLQHQANPALDY